MTLRDEAWRNSAACLGSHPAKFFPARQRSISQQARTICDDCCVRAACLTEAMRQPSREDFGIWGGTTELERDKLRGVR